MSPSNMEFSELRRQNAQLKVKRQTRICDENTLMLNLATLEIKSPDRIISMTSAGNFYEYCQKIKKNLVVTDALLKHCVPLEQDDNLFIRLINGTRKFHNLTCSVDSKYHKCLDKHMTCLEQLHEEFLECEGPDDWYEETRGICEKYQTILNCNYFKVSELCGLEAAHYIHLITIDVFDSVLPKEVKCNVSREPEGVTEALTDNQSNKIHFDCILCLTIFYLIYSNSF
ncbi:uncharacterized protein LOC134832350 [Culicoides brevitarsis]|uniref:uncharacterized protein LOC134832350 n=1 Tax=Culicoides brevitarsis TaxID=469753 RepID=UPI00307C5DA9